MGDRNDREMAGAAVSRRAFLVGAGLASTAPAGGLPRASAQGAGPSIPAGFTRLRVVEGTLTADGKTGKVFRIQGDDGTLGYAAAGGGRFRVALENATAEAVSIHWHGLILANGQDGVPYVTQAPLKPGEQRLYDFPLVQTGTYWMHSHFGLQEQALMTAPLILRDPRAAPGKEQEVVVMLNDFTAEDPAAILAGLRRPAAPMPMGGRDLTDVKYDAFLANRRTLADPEVIPVRSGRPVRLRLINAASATNFVVRPGRLRAEAVAVDGEEIAPFPAPEFELAIAQRLDLRLAIPRGEGAYPILAQGEGTDRLAGVVLATPRGRVPALSAKAKTVAGALTNGQERRLHAARSLPLRPVDRRLRLALNGDMARYAWTLNGEAWPRITPLRVKQGERVEIAMVNETGMAHPMHLHGHVFQVVEMDGVRMRGARRDTVLVMPRQTLKVEFDAAYPGYWMLHCHVLYHQAAGMMTVLHYEGFENRSYDPLASLGEFAR